MTYQLICEGLCNPFLELADGLAAEFIQSKNRNAPFDGAGPMIAAQRKLKYTLHVIDGSGCVATCLVCQAKRGYGGRLLRKTTTAVAS